MRMTSVLLVFIGGIFVSCDASETPENPENKEITTAKVTQDTASQPVPLALEISQGDSDLVVNDYLKEALLPIRENFRRINTKENWTTIESIALEESTEGGEALFYYDNDQLKKIVARHFGELGQQLNEYYLLADELSFVFERTLHYDRPIYDDDSTMVEDDAIDEQRSYFLKGELLHQLASGDCGAPFSKDYLLEEEKRITAEYAHLLKLK